MFADGEGFGGGGDGGDEGALGLAREGEEYFDFGVGGEAFRAVEINGGAGGIDLVRSGAGAPKGRGGVVTVADDKGGQVDEDAGAFFGSHGKAPVDGAGEGVGDGLLFVLVDGGGAEALVGFDQEDFRADAFEAHEAGATDLAAVEADVIRAEAGRQRGVKKELVTGLWNFKKQVSGFHVPIEWEQPVALFHTGDFFGNRGG